MALSKAEREAGYKAVPQPNPQQIAVSRRVAGGHLTVTQGMDERGRRRASFAYDDGSPVTHLGRPGADQGRTTEPARKFTCPLAPSVNNLHVNYTGKLHGGRARGASYKRWLHDAGWAIRAQSVSPVEGVVRVLIEAPLPRRRDVDNALKPTLDLIVRLGIIADDNLVDDLRIVRVTGRDDMEISIWAI